MVFVVLLYAILASTFTIAKIALEFAKPFFLIGFRMVVAGGLMLSFLLLFKRKSLRVLNNDDWLLFVKVAVFHVYLAFIPEFWALQFVSSTKTNFIYSSTPFIAALLSYILLKEKLSVKKSVGMLIGLAALVPIFLTGGGLESSMELLKISLPEVVLLGAVISAAYAWFIVKELLNKGYSLLLINGIAMMFGGLGALLTSFFVEGWNSSTIVSFGPFIGWTMLLVFVANIVVYNFYGFLLKKYSITFITSAGFLCPVFGSFYGYIFLSEKITWNHFVALLLIIVGLYIFYNDEKKSNRISV